MRLIKNIYGLAFNPNGINVGFYRGAIGTVYKDVNNITVRKLCFYDNDTTKNNPFAMENKYYL